jgi:hypothetical protein
MPSTIIEEIEDGMAESDADAPIKVFWQPG